jgi:hypothetical protein
MKVASPIRVSVWEELEALCAPAGKTQLAKQSAKVHLFVALLSAVPILKRVDRLSDDAKSADDPIVASISNFEQRPIESRNQG